jgi:hypothetical protein
MTTPSINFKVVPITSLGQHDRPAVPSIPAGWRNPHSGVGNSLATRVHVTAAVPRHSHARIARGNFLTRSGQFVGGTVDSRAPRATGLTPQMRYH